MGKLLRATRRMVNETFGTNFGRVHDVDTAWGEALKENAEHTRQQEERKLARVALQGPRIAELKDGSGLPETKVGSPEFVAKMSPAHPRHRLDPGPSRDLSGEKDAFSPRWECALE